MREIHYNCYKIATRINIKNIAQYFNLYWPTLGIVEHVILEGRQLETILKYDTSTKKAYVFEFGCVTLINFNANDTSVFINFIESLTGKISSIMMFKYNEVYKLRINKEGYFKTNKDNGNKILYGRNIETIIAVVLAKSTALLKVECEIDELMDQVEHYVDYLQKGSLHTRSKKFSITTAQIIRFEYESIYSIEILERITGVDKKIKFKDIYDDVSTYYELNDRFNIIRNKIENLRRITRAYTKLSYERNESRLYIFEIFLLALFPLSYLVRYFMK